MLRVTVFLVSLIYSSFSSKIWHKLDLLEVRVDKQFNKTEMEIIEIKEIINRLNNSEQRCCEHTHEDDAESEQADEKEVNNNDFVPDIDKQHTRLDHKMKRVYDHVERNSHALMDEFQKTMAVLRRKQQKINTKIDTNKENIETVYESIGGYEKSNNAITENVEKNDQRIGKFENKLSVLDKTVDDLEKKLGTDYNAYMVFWESVTKLEKKTIDINENLENNIFSVANIDHRLVEMDRRYFDFVSDWENFKRDMKQEIEELFENVIAPSNKKTTKKTCPLSWIQHGNMCYLYDKATGYDWLSALSMCVSLGAKLAEPDTKEEMDFLRAFVHGWIGASDRETEGTFIWENSKNPVEDFPWWPGMPDNKGGDQDCVSLWGSMVNDEECSKRYRFVCEKTLE